MPRDRAKADGWLAAAKAAGGAANDRRGAELAATVAAGPAPPAVSPEAPPPARGPLSPKALAARPRAFSRLRQGSPSAVFVCE